MNFSRLIFALSLLTCMAVHAADTVDRIVATVNGQIILQSDWDDAVRYESFIAKRTLDTVTFADRQVALDHLIDQELLREQVRAPESVQPTSEEVQDQLKAIREQYSESDASWRAVLTTHGLTEAELLNRLTVQLKLTHLVDVRLRPSANVTSKSIQSYYQHELLPQLQQSGAKEVPLADVSPKIKELLTQQRISELLVSWLQELHAGSEIRTQLYSSAGESQPQ